MKLSIKSSVMWKYIGQEQAVLTQQMRSRQTYEYADQNGESIQTIYFVAHGSSFNAAVCMEGFFSRFARIRAFAYTPGKFQSGGSPILLEDPATTLVVVISQTGTSTGAIRSLGYAHSLGFRTLGITAESKSPLAEIAQHTLYLLCGLEESNAKTMGYSATLLLLMLLALALGSRKGVLDIVERDICLDELERMIQLVPEVLEQTKFFCEQTTFGEGLYDLYVIGSGMNLGTAQEGQLKLMETMCIPTMFNDIGEFSHGMHRAINSDSSVLLIRSADNQEGLIQQAYSSLTRITNKVWMIDTSADPTASLKCLRIPSFPKTGSLILVTLAVQVMSVFAPEYNDLDPNRSAHDDFVQLLGTRL